MSTAKQPVHDSLSRENIARLAKLSRLQISEEEAVTLERDLNGILAYVAELNSIPVDSISPMYHVHGEANVFRTDEALPFADKEKILSQVPERSGQFVRIPLVVSREK